MHSDRLNYTPVIGVYAWQFYKVTSVVYDGASGRTDNGLNGTVFALPWAQWTGVELTSILAPSIAKA